MKLSKREKWLMGEAFKCGIYSSGSGSIYTNIEDWLNDSVVDGVTVEIILVADAPEPELPEELKE